MNLFEYTPQPYKSTRVDLPLDFIYKQLETKQKEFDAQAAAVDKATENFMKLDYGMLTEDAYKRVMESYLPRLESIRDNLFATGNVAMAAPDLAKFTTDLAGDPEVKNMLKDAQLTETYRQGVQQGLYTDKDLPGLFVAPGKLRDQLGVGQKTSPIYYSPMEFVDPLTELGAEADKYVKEIERDNPAVFRQTKDGRTITSQEGIKQRKYEKLREYLDTRLDSWRLDPKNQGYFYRSTGSKPETYTVDKWISEVSDPLSRALAYENRSIETQISGTPNVPGLDKPSGDGTTVPEKPKAYAPPIRTNLSTQIGGIPSYSTGVFPEDNITTYDEFEKDLNIASKDYGTSFNEIARIAGITTLIKDGGLTEARNWINNNYEIENGQYRLKSGSSAPEITPELHRTFKKFFDSGVALNKGGVLQQQIMKEAGVASYDSKVIQDAKDKSFKLLKDHFPGDLGSISMTYRQTPDQVLTNIMNGNTTYVGVDYEEFDERKKEWYDDILYNELKDKPEGKMYKVFENFKNRLSQMSLTQFPDNKETDAAEQTMIDLIKSAGSSARNAITNKALDKTKLDEQFTEILPYKDGDPAKGVDYSQITTSIGYHPKYGVVGVMSFNGNYFTVSLDDINLDKRFTSEYPDYVTEIRFYQQVSNSFKRNRMQNAEFEIGNSKFNINLKSKNLASANPDIKYTEKFDGVNEYEYDNLGQIFEKALKMANEKESFYDIWEKDINREYWEKYSQLDMLDAAGAKKLLKERDEKLENLRRAKTQSTTVGDGSSGKSGEWRTSPKTPLK